MGKRLKEEGRARARLGALTSWGISKKLQENLPYEILPLVASSEERREASLREADSGGGRGDPSEQGAFSGTREAVRRNGRDVEGRAVWENVEVTTTPISRRAATPRGRLTMRAGLASCARGTSPR